MAIFGTLVKNEQNADSDVDLIVEFNHNVGIKFNDLADELESIIDIKVDLVSKNGIKEKYYKMIQPDFVYV